MSDEKHRLLILDDQPEITDIVEDFVQDRYDNVETITTNDPKDALAKVHELKFSVIITDHHMPEISGTQFLKELRRSEGLNKETPVVFLTAMKKEVEEEIGNEFNDVIVINKIDQVQSILDVINKYIN